jgi:membrane-associated phospholipid phosphatase
MMILYSLSYQLERSWQLRPWLLLALFIVLLMALAVAWRRLNRDTLWIWAEKRRQEVAGWELLQQLRTRWPRAWAFIGRRLSPAGYLGLHLTIGLVLSLVALSVFGMVANNVVGEAALTRFDQALATTLYGRATPEGIFLFTAITLLGSVVTLTVLGVCVGLMLLLRGQQLRLAGWLIALAGGGLLNWALKAFFQRPRPHFDLPLTVVPGWSFPSGHAMGSLIAYGMLAYLLLSIMQERRIQSVTIVIASLLVLLIGFSRLYLGVHYFSDVIAGYAAGTVWLSVCVSGVEVARRRKVIQQRENRKLVGKAGQLT